MKKITLWLFTLFTCWQMNAQTGTVVIGIDDGIPNTNTEAPSPLQDYWKTQRLQMLYTASELSAAGLVAGDITSIGWVATAIGTSGLQEDYTISMKSTTSTVLTTTFETGTTIVYGPTDFTPSAIGNVNFTLSTPFSWDGTSNIIVQVCAGKSTGTYTQNVVCSNATTADNKTVYATSDTSTTPCTTATGTVINQRPLLVIVGNIASCLAPLNVVSSAITAYTATISWDASTSAPADGYEYFVSTSNVTPTGSGIATAATSVNLTDLLSQTTYYTFVRAICSTTSNSSWNGLYTFTTACAPVTMFPHLETFDTFLPNACWIKGDNGDLTTGPAIFGTNNWVADGLGNVGTTGAMRYEIWLASANDWIISPQFTIPATGYELKFDAAATQYNSTNVPTTSWEADDKIEILVSTDGLTNWTPIFTYDNTNQPGTTATPNTVDLSAYAGETIRIAIRAFEGTANGSADIDFSIDNFQVRLAPACETPSPLASNVTGDSATVSWNAVPSAILGYEYVLDTVAADPTGAGTAITALTYAASGISASTVYYFHIRSACSVGTFSTWTTISFTTGCSSTDVPYTQDFESTTTPDLPACTSQENIGLGSPWIVEENPGFGFESNALAYSWDSNNDANVWFYTQGINLTGGTAYKISYDYGATGYDLYPENLKVAYGTSASAIDMTTELANHPSVILEGPINNLVEFTPTTSGVYYFGFNAYSPADSFYLFVDNIVIDVLLGNNSFDNANFMYYPNPVKNVLNLNYNQNISLVEVYNLLGQKMTSNSFDATTAQVDMSSYTSGVYLVKVTSNNTTKTIRVIKE